jgi:uncharacterized protein
MGEKPVPIPTTESRPFWEAASAGRLMYQRCKQCERPQFYPRLRCRHCGSESLDCRESTGRATVHAATRVHIGQVSFKGDAPYDVVLVDLEEGFRMLVNVMGNPADIAIGDSESIVFELRDGVSLPQFKRDDVSAPVSAPAG